MVAKQSKLPSDAPLRPSPLADQEQRLDDIEIGDAMIWRPYVGVSFVDVLHRMFAEQGKVFQAEVLGDDDGFLLTRRH